MFVGIGAALANSGPAGLLIAFLITGMVIWTVIQCIGEMATLFPVEGNFPHFVSRFVDPAMGLALGWNCESTRHLPAMKIGANAQTGGSASILSCPPSPS